MLLLVRVLALARCLSMASRPIEDSESFEHHAAPSSETEASPPEVIVDCKMEGKEEDKMRVMLLANGLANDALQDEFGEMVNGYMKETGKTKLKATVFWDSCFLKESVWNHAWGKEDLKSGSPGAASWRDLKSVDSETVLKIFQPYYAKRQLEDWGCEDFAESFMENKVLKNNVEIIHVSLIDRLEGVGMVKLLASLAAPQLSLNPKLISEDPLPEGVTQEHIDAVVSASKKDAKKKFAKLKDLILDSDIIAFDGGNPDLHALGIGLYGLELRNLLRDVAKKGKIFIGRSAGAMILTSAIVTYEPEPAIHNHLLFPHVWPTMQGLGLVGKCAIRPHWAPKWLNGASYFAQQTGLVLLNVRNGEGATCIDGMCKQLLHTPITEEVGNAEKYDECKDVAHSPCSDKDASSADCVMRWRRCFKVCADGAGTVSVDCQLQPEGADKLRVMLLANGLANKALQDSFGEMVKDYTKETGKTKLKATVFWDSCFLKESVWNYAWEKEDLTSGSPGAASWKNLKSVDSETVLKIFQPYYAKRQLEDWGCEDFAESFMENEVLKNSVEINHVSLIDRLEGVGMVKLLASLAAPQPSLDPKLISDDPLPEGITREHIEAVLLASKNDAKKKLPKLKDLILDSDIIAFDGGNPDLHALGIGLYGLELRNLLRDVAKKGKIFIGRSAGAMILTSAIVTYEPEPAIYNHLLFPHVWPKMQGLGLVGKCAIRPHYAPKWLNGASYFAQRTGLVLLNVRNGEGATCIHGTCKQLLHTPIVEPDAVYVGMFDECKGVARSACARPDDLKSAECVMRWRRCFKACAELQMSKSAASMLMGVVGEFIKQVTER
eukprot:TRINITY_DN5606_c0_g1_i1.p1 TRINITY_DN5606_c0_g1~~TRINITY_DN5606_c0_g1_i1.p1  ORF type:complete len:835 (+),score=123.59 TRINITY_DN5606_c0_g1_i1:50-2554(+)